MKTAQFYLCAFRVIAIVFSEHTAHTKSRQFISCNNFLFGMDLSVLLVWIGYQRWSSGLGVGWRCWRFAIIACFGSLELTQWPFEGIVLRRSLVGWSLSGIYLCTVDLRPRITWYYHIIRTYVLHSSWQIRVFILAFQGKINFLWSLYRPFPFYTP